MQISKTNHMRARQEPEPTNNQPLCHIANHVITLRHISSSFPGPGGPV